MTATTVSVDRPARVALNRLLWAAPLAGVLAGVANLLVFFIARAAIGELVFPIQAGATPQALPAIAVFMGSLVPALGAGLFLALLSKLTARPLRVFQIVAVLFLLLSFVGPLQLPLHAAGIFVLNLMHVVAGGVIVAVLTRFSQEG